MFRLFALVLLAAAAAALPHAAPAQDAAAHGGFAVGADRYVGGAFVTLDEPGVDDVFAAGASVRLVSPVSGSVHAFGRRVRIEGAVGGDVYATGMMVAISGPVTGDVTVAGYEVETARIGGDLRAGGTQVTVSGPVAGSALLAADDLRIDGEVAGAAHLSAGMLEFGPDARLLGPVFVYEKTPGALAIPETVAAPDRIERRRVEDWHEAAEEHGGWNLSRIIASFLLGVIVVAAIAALIAAVVPERLAAARRTILERPFGMLWLGFVALSVPVGAAVLLALTLIGLVVSPAAVLLAVLAGLAGYVVGVYSLGVGLMLAAGRDEPESIGQRAAAAGIGALAAGLVAAIPFLGWLFVLAVTLTGTGAIAAALFHPHFGAPAR